MDAYLLSRETRCLKSMYLFFDPTIVRLIVQSNPPSSRWESLTHPEGALYYYDSANVGLDLILDNCNR